MTAMLQYQMQNWVSTWNTRASSTFVVIRKSLLITPNYPDKPKEDSGYGSGSCRGHSDRGGHAGYIGLGKGWLRQW